MSRLKEKYKNEVVDLMRKRFAYDNVMAIPKITKIVINMGVGETIRNAKAMDSAVDELQSITGQKAVVTKAKKPISAFKLRKGMPIGCMVTLRGNRMYEFFDKLVNVALPRVRDFRGISSKALDGRGNYTLGIKEHIIFPEIDYDKIDKIKWMNITIVTSAQTDDEARTLLALMGMPFRQ